MDKIRYAIIALTLALCAVGCQDNSDGLTSKQVEAGTRQKQILQRSGGDWSKLTETDRQYLIQQSRGNERVARMKFDAMSGRPPSGGPNSGPPPK